MFILKIDLSRMRNNTHFQHGEDLFRLMEKNETVRTHVSVQFDAWLALHRQEGAALKKIRKSIFTEEIRAVNRERNTIFRGMSKANFAAVNHYTPAIAEAGRRIQIVLDTYGNINRLSIDDKTAAINKLIKELFDSRHKDMTVVKLDLWADELRRRNQTLTDLVSSRYAETATRNDDVLKDIRAKTDDAYRTLTLCIESLWHLLPEEEQKKTFAEFIRLLNAVTDHYNNLLARSKGRSNASGTDNDDADTDNPDTPENNS